jgi:redox-sensitive bicupin YhaK (pirin superfamily)
MKATTTIIEGKNVTVGDLLVNRLIPASPMTSVGPFLLLDHAYPVDYLPDTAINSLPNEHPHRGLVAFTYVLKGEVEHSDSLGNHETAGEGGAHWLSSGRGIIHEERVSARLAKSGGAFHAIQFWTNIPAARKGDPPEYRLLAADVLPGTQLPNQAGVMRVLLGKYGVMESPVETLSQAFVYRITLNAKSEFQVVIKGEMKVAVFVPDNPILVDGNPTAASQLVVVEANTGKIALRNPGIYSADAFILGGPQPTERIVVHGPFVMNSDKEITDAYRGFFAGEYGTISRLND